MYPQGLRPHTSDSRLYLMVRVTPFNTKSVSGRYRIVTPSRSSMRPSQGHPVVSSNRSSGQEASCVSSFGEAGKAEPVSPANWW